MLRPKSFSTLLLLTALVAFGPLSTDMYLPGLPSMIDAFSTDVEHVQLTLSVFLFGFALGQLVYGPLSDRFGRRPILMIGVGLYAAASIVCALAPSIDALVVARFFQALGACSGPVLARTVIRDVHGSKESARVLSYMATAMAVAPLVAPGIGGVMVEIWGWRSIFTFLALFGGFLLFGIAAGLPETNVHKTPSATLPGPLITNYLRLAKDAPYQGFNLANACAYSTIFIFISGSPYIFIDLLGQSPALFGVSFGVVVAGFMLGATLSGRLNRRLGIKRLIAAGALVQTLFGGLALFFALIGIAHPSALIAPLFAMFAGAGLVMPNSMAGAIGPFPKMAGTASALVGFSQMALAALMGILLSALHDGSPVPMTAMLCLMGLGGLGAYWRLIRR